MLKISTFRIAPALFGFLGSEVDKANKFLEEHSAKIVATGTFMFKDRAVFVWTDDTEEEVAKEILIQSIKKGMLDGLTSLAEAEVAAAFARSKGLVNAPGFKEKVMTAENQKLDLQKHLSLSKALIERIEKGEWPEENV